MPESVGGVGGEGGGGGLQGVEGVERDMYGRYKCNGYNHHISK